VGEDGIEVIALLWGIGGRRLTIYLTVEGANYLKSYMDNEIEYGKFVEKNAEELWFWLLGDLS
jgi:hypothetical protein